MTNCFMNEVIYKLNPQLSKIIYKKMIAEIKLKDCYNNVLKVAVKYKAELNSGIWRIAFCYKKIQENCYVRHCAIINKQDEIIDPTHYATKREKHDNVEYLVFDILERKEFFDLVSKNDWDASLIDYYRQQEAENIVSAWERGKKIFGL